MSNDDLYRRLADTVREDQLLSPGEAVVVAVSGGADSVAMAHLLAGLRDDEAWGIQPHVAHLNHQLRGAEADGDAAFVEELARELKLPCTVEAVDVRAYATERGVSVEQAGRDCRFAFYNRLCLRLGVKAVALAHHADDNAETVLHRLVRGTGIRGLGGIRSSRPLREGSDIRVIRPMLGMRRSEIEDYLGGSGISYRQDITNESDAHTRNRIRHEVLPLLRDRFNPQVVEALNRLADQATGLEDYLTETAERMMESLVVEHTDEQLVLHGPSLARKARVIQLQLVRQAIMHLGIGECDLSYGHLNAVVELAADTEGSKTLELPGGLKVTRRYSRMVFERVGRCRLSTDDRGQHRVATEGVTALPAHGIEISAEIIDVDADTIANDIRQLADRGQTSNEEWLDADRIQLPLLARSRKPGDRFLPLGMTAMKKLSDFFIDEKIDAHERERTVVLCDQLGPVWVVPFRIDDRARLSAATRRVLRLQARGMAGGA